MVDFANGISDAATGERLVRTLQGPGAFRRFKNHIYNHVKLVREWLSPRLDHSAWPDHIRRNIHEGENIPHLIERNREESHDA
jgi:hypothetical protein